MQARDVIGRKIVDVRQERTTVREYGGQQEWSVMWFELDNGKRVVFHPHETDLEPIVTASIVKPNNTRKE